MVDKVKRKYLFDTELGTKGPEFNIFEKIGLGAASGGLKIVESIAELGAAFSDYAFNTDFITALEENFPRINVTDGPGKFVEIALQYGIPYSYALKIGSKLHGMKKLRELGQSSSSVSKIAGKMGYYGLPAVGTDFAFGAARDVTLGETFGLYEGFEKSKQGKEGSELAKEVLKQKTLLGLEGGALAGLITTALPPVLGATATGVATGAGYVSRGVSPIINPVAELVGNSAVGTGARKTLDAIKFVKEKIDPTSLDQLRMTKSSEMTFIQKVKKGVGDLITPQGQMAKQQFESFQNLENTMKTIRGDLGFFITRADNELTKAGKILSSSRGESLTKQKSILQDVARALDLQDVTGMTNFKTNMKKTFGDEDSKDLIDAIKNLRDYAEELTEKTVNNFAKPVLGKKAKEAAPKIHKEIRNLLDRQIGVVYKAFDKGSKFKFSGKQFELNRQAAIKDAADVLKTGAMKGQKDAAINATAKKQIDQLIRLAQDSKSEGNFFFRIRDLKKKDPKKSYTSISDEMLKRRRFDVPGKYALSLKNLLGGEFKPLTAFTNKYMAIASQLGTKKYINEIVRYNKELGTAVAGRGEKFLFNPTKTTRQLIDEGVDPAAAQALVDEDLVQQIAKEYNIRPEIVNKTQLDPSILSKVDEDVFGVYDAINPKLSDSKRVGGFHTSSDIAQALAGVENYTNFLVNLPLYKTFLMGKAGTQVGKTILSPVTQIRNFTSAAFFALHNGHMGNPFGLRKGDFSFADVLKTHIDEIFPEGRVTNEALQKLAQDAARKNELGVTSGSVVQREIDDLLIDVAKDGSGYKTTEEIFDKIFKSKAFKNLYPFEPGTGGKVYNKAQQFYTKGDDIWKDYGYRFTLSQLNKAFDGKPDNAATVKLIENAHLQVFGRRPITTNEFGKLKSKDELLEEFSAEYIKNTYPNYQYVPQAIKALRRLPVGNFISFPAEILRTSGNLIQLTGRELAVNTGDAALDAYFRQMGSRRLIGQMAGYATGPALAAYAVKALGISDKQYAALTEGDNVAEWNKFSDLIIIGKEKVREAGGVENVKYRYLNFAYQNPYDYIRAPFYTFFGRMASGKKMAEEDIDRFVNSSFEAFRSLFEPFIDEAILTERISDLIFRGGRTRAGSLVYDENDQLGDILAKGFGHIVKGVSPGVLTQISNVSSAVAQDQTRYGKQYKLGDELLALLSGIRVYEADIKNNLNYAINDFRRSDFINKRNAGALIFSANVTPNTIVSAYQEYVDESYKSYKKARKTIDDAVELGMRESDVFASFQQRKIRKEIINTLITKKFIPPDYMSFFNDQRFQNILLNRGEPDLFPFRTLQEIRSGYFNIDLLRSLTDVRRTLNEKRQEETVEQAPTQVQGTTAQAPGLTANVSPVPSAQPGLQQVAGLTPTATSPKTVRERIVEGDELLRDLA